ncbi:DNA alkylation repair protein [Fusobacterium sp. 1001295B_180824_G3]|uniref:DNA alkylation repair protein n=2 Tax=Fusobacterium TaxID=848 RepID=UPI00189A6CA9|nr:DNA alkylation repair protein [Fusobacterium sp. 1001295B_180824_G3]
MEIESLIFKTEKEYKEFLDYLFSIRDVEYKNFNKKIIGIDEDMLIGIRTPILRNLGKKIAKISGENFLNLFEKLFTKKKIKYHEEKVLYGFIIGYSKINFEERLKRIDFFINIIDNWAVCDIVDSTFKFINKNKEDFYRYLTSKLSTTNPWEQRFVLVILLAYYIEEKYLKDIFKICERIKSEEYYVNMAKAWLLSICYVKFKNETYKFLEKTNLDNWTVNKAIQKTRESLRVTKEDKEKILVLKRK